MSRGKKSSRSGTEAVIPPHVEEEIRNVLSEDDTKVLSELSSEFQVFFALMSKVFSTMIKNNANTVGELENKVITLENQVADLNKTVEEHAVIIEDMQQSAHKGVYLLSGPDVPCGTSNENCKETIQSALKNKLNYNMDLSKITEVHRVGIKDASKAHDFRPIKLRITDDECRHDLLQSFIRVKPRMYLNESLTPQRRSLFHKTRQIRRDHPQLIAQTFTRDGVIYVKRIARGTKVAIKSERNLMIFLENNSDSALDEAQLGNLQTTMNSWNSI